MASKGGMNKTVFDVGAPKKTRQGKSSRTLLSATSRNAKQRNIEDKEKVK